MTVKLAKAWRTRTAALRERLTGEQLEALRRARMGYPPATLLGWHLSSDTGATHEPPLVSMESIVQSMAECFPWPAPADLPGGRQWVDLRHEINELFKLIGELREAMAAGKIESALIRSMALGTMFARLAYLLLDGEAIASGAASGRGREKTLPAIKATQEDKRATRDIELQRLLFEDKENRLYAKQRSNNAIAKRITPLYAEWAKGVGEKPLSADTIRKWLAKAI